MLEKFKKGNFLKQGRLLFCFKEEELWAMNFYIKNMS